MMLPLSLTLALAAPFLQAPDSDGDGLSDFAEVHKHRTDPRDADSDGDGAPDGDWLERREFTYVVRSVVQVMKPVTPEHLTDDFQDVRVLDDAGDRVELEAVHYPFLGHHDEEREAAADPIGQHLRAAVEEGFSGVVLIAHRGDVLFHRAFSRDPSVHADTAFWIGSVTKTFTSAAVMRLQEQGELSVADPISQHLKGVPPEMCHVAVHHLLTHTWGVGTHYAADALVDREKAIEAILALPVETAPGNFAYSNDGYSLLALLIDLVSDRGYEGYLRKEILDPAGMSDTGFWWVPSTDADVDLAPVANVPDADGARPTWGHRGASGLYATARDLCRWGRALARGSVLSDSSRQVAFAPHVSFSPTVAYGYGWEVIRSEHGRVLGHFGANSEIGHQADFKRYVDQDLVMILLSNGPEDVATETFAGVEEIFFENRQLYREQRTPDGRGD